MIEGTFRKHEDQWVASFALADPDAIGDLPAAPVSGDRAVLVRQNGERREVIVGACVVKNHYGHALHQFTNGLQATADRRPRGEVCHDCGSPLRAWEGHGQSGEYGMCHDCA